MYVHGHGPLLSLPQQPRHRSLSQSQLSLISPLTSPVVEGPKIGSLFNNLPQRLATWDLSMRSPVNRIVSHLFAFAYFFIYIYLYAIFSCAIFVGRCIPTAVVWWLIVALVLTQLDYCNNVLAELQSNYRPGKRSQCQV